MSLWGYLQNEAAFKIAALPKPVASFCQDANYRVLIKTASTALKQERSLGTVVYPVQASSLLGNSTILALSGTEPHCLVGLPWQLHRAHCKMNLLRWRFRGQFSLYPSTKGSKSIDSASSVSELFGKEFVCAECIFCFFLFNVGDWIQSLCIL